MASTAGIPVGLNAYQCGDYAMALRIFRQFIDQGNVTAQFNLGLMCGNGRGVTQDYVQAHIWYKPATASGINNASKLCDRLAQ